MSQTISEEFKTYLYQVIQKYGGNQDLKEVLEQLKDALDGMSQSQNIESSSNNKLMTKIKELQNVKLKLDKQVQTQVDEIVRLQDMKMAIQKEVEKQQILVNERKEQILNQEMANKQISQNIVQLNQKINDIQQQIQQNEYQMQLEEQHHQIKIKELEYNHVQHVENLQKQIQLLKNEKVAKADKIRLIQAEQQHADELSKKQYTHFKDEMLKQIEEKQNMISKINQQNLSNQIQLNQLLTETKQIQADYFNLEMVIPGIRHQIQNQNERKLSAEQARLQRDFEAHMRRKESEVSHNENVRRLESLQNENTALKAQLKQLDEAVEASQKAIAKNYVGKYHNYLIQNEKINKTVIIKKIELEDLRKLLASAGVPDGPEEAAAANTESELQACQKTFQDLLEKEKKLHGDLEKLRAMPAITEVAKQNTELKRDISALVAKQTGVLREKRQKQAAIDTQNQIIAAKQAQKSLQAIAQKKPENERELQQQQLLRRRLGAGPRAKGNALGQISQLRQPGRVLQ